MTELPREEQLAAAFVDLANIHVQDLDVLDSLHTLAAHCVELLDVTAAGVMLAAPGGHPRHAAASDEGTRKLELASIEWDEGSCWDCYHSKQQLPQVPLHSSATRKRWPRFAPRAVELGFTSVATCPLRLHDQVIGALNLFSDLAGPLNASHLRLAQALADTATVGVLYQRAMSEQRTVNAQLQTALDSRIIIEQAKGHLAHRLGIDVDEAFTILRRYARNHRMRLTELAGQVLQGTPDLVLTQRRDG